MWIQSPAELTGYGAPRSLLFAETEVGLETVKQSEVSQKEKQVSYKNTYMWNLEKIVWMNLFVKQR